MKIKNIIPAPDWFAVLNVDEKPELYPLIGRAVRPYLIDEDTEDEVVGMITCIDAPHTEAAEDNTNFFCYVHSSEMEKMKEWFEAEIRKAAE